MKTSTIETTKVKSESTDADTTKQYPLVTIVVLNFNGTHVTRELLNSLRKISYPEVEILLVDNASVDRSILQLKDEFPEINLVPLDKNMGYSGGNNAGIRAASGDLVLLINNDVEVTRGFLEPMVEIFMNDPKAGMVSPKIVYYQRGELIQYAGSDGINPWTGRGKKNGNREVDNRQYDYVAPTDLVHGACVMVSRKLIETIGLLEESYFIYYEEHDWAERAKVKGFGRHYCGTSKIYHKESVTMGIESPFKSYFMARNRLLFLRRNVPYPAFFTSTLIFLLLAVPKQFMVYLLKAKISNLRAYMRGIFWHFKRSSQWT